MTEGTAADDLNTNMEHVDYNTAESIAFFNSLNRLLKEKEQQIVARAAIYLAQINERLNGNDTFTNDYELIAEVQYMIEGEDDAVHEYHINCRNHMEGTKIPGLLCSTEDWRECYMPVLDEPYCYLLHDLIGHSGLGNRIFDISTIWIDIHLYAQHCIKLCYCPILLCDQ